MGLGERRGRFCAAGINHFIEIDREQRGARAHENLGLVEGVELQHIRRDHILPAMVLEIVGHRRHDRSSAFGFLYQRIQSSGVFCAANPGQGARRDLFSAARKAKEGDASMARLTRRSIVLGAMLAPLSAQAQNWPSGPIRIIVPFPPGASVDAVGRLAGAGLQQRLGVTVVVENRPGASGSTGAAVVAKSAPDGNTWLIVFDTHAVNPSLLPNYPFDNDKDLEPVSLIATAPYV